MGAAEGLTANLAECAHVGVRQELEAQAAQLNKSGDLVGLKRRALHLARLVGVGGCRRGGDAAVQRVAAHDWGTCQRRRWRSGVAECVL